MIEFFGCVAAAMAVAAPVVRNFADILSGGRRIYDFASDVLGRFAKKVPADQQQQVIRMTLAQAAAMPQVEFEKKARSIVDAAIPEQPAEVRQAVSEYISLMPARIRQTFARPEDPTGTTAPAKFTIDRPEELIPLLPPRPPMFREGDMPPNTNKWKLIERLGIGGFGEVWKAKHTLLKERYAAFKFCLDPASQKRMFEHEPEVINQVMSQIDHPHIVKLQEVDFNDTAPWLQYEYVPGGDLGQLIATWPNDLAVRARLAVDVLRTLARTAAACHDLKPAVIHRDLKPGNVLVARDGKLKITDFGISDTLAWQALDEARVATASGATCSTPSVLRWAHTPLYASLQQKNGDKPHPSDDVHALGVMLYQMLFGNINLPLGSDFRDDLAEQHVCEDLIALLSRSVASRVERRYGHAGELADALDRLPKNLIVEPIVVSVADQEKLLFEEFDRRATDASKKNELARAQLDQREWAAAVTTLESIFHPILRDNDLYTRALGHRDGKRYLNSLGMEFALVPKDTFWMGGQDGKCGDKQITIERDFYIGVYPVTQEEWQKVMGTNPSHFRTGGGGAAQLSGLSDTDRKRLPVECVSWNDCQQFLQKLNAQGKDKGMLYRLPREAEWKYASRAAATSQADCSWNFYFRVPTNTLSPQQANTSESALQRTSPVGSYEPNALGIHDMHGNVWEWCEDWYDASQKYRVLRGGSWYVDAGNCRSAYRNGLTPGGRDYKFGLRLLLWSR